MSSRRVAAAVLMGAIALGVVATSILSHLQSEAWWGVHLSTLSYAVVGVLLV